uniref:Uncharacterized protein n=1 Tax=Ascaris lumbricoides TaxID=6252 RepID=A0A0M3INK9_ASCLU
MHTTMTTNRRLRTTIAIVVRRVVLVISYVDESDEDEEEEEEQLIEQTDITPNEVIPTHELPVRFVDHYERFIRIVHASTQLNFNTIARNIAVCSPFLLLHM